MPTIQFAIIIIIFLILLALGLSIFVAARILNNDLDISERVENYTILRETESKHQDERRGIRFLRLRLRINSMMSVFTSEELSLQLVSASWPITETEYIIIRITLMAIGFFIGWVSLQSLLPGVGFAAITFFVPAIYLKYSISQRRLKFGRQLVDVLVLVTGGIRAGFSFLQALDLVIEEMTAPASEEFRRVRREVGLGLSLGRALSNLAERMQNDDLDLLVTSIQINSQSGGNLSVMLGAVTETIRERIRLFSEIRSITAQQRNTGYILSIMPFMVAGILSIINPTYMSRLFEPTIYLCIPIGAIIFVIIGNIIVRLLVRIEV